MRKKLYKKIVLENEKCPSWNSMYSGGHWTKRRQKAENIHNLVHSYVRKCTPVGFLVDIEVIAYFKGKQIDADNVASKFYIDGLKGFVLEDDDPRYVRRVTMESKKGKTNKVEILIYKVY